MPRMARRRNPETTHHIMCRSVSEIRLFKNDDDKVNYLQLMALYCQKFEYSILAYCLMDTHVHIQFDPQGCDISKFMHGVNLCYAQYYNRKQHLDDFGLINTDFILSQFDKKPEIAKKVYAEFVISCNKVNQKQKFFELIDEYMSKESYEYRSHRYIYYRELSPKKIIETVAKIFDILPEFINIKYCHSVTDFKAISIFLMRDLCDYSNNQICKELGNLTISLLAKLNNRGFTLIKNDPKYKELLPNLLKEIRVA